MNISREDIIKTLKRKEYEPTTLRGLYRLFGVSSKTERKKFKALIAELEKEGKILRDADHRYFLAGKDIEAGTISFSRRKHVAFVTTDNGDEILVYPEDAGFAMHGDRVLVRITGSKRGMKQGKVVKVIERGIKKMVGTLFLHHYQMFFEPDDPRLPDFFKVLDPQEGKEGEKVIVEIVHYPSPRTTPMVKVLQVLGDPNDPAVDLPTVIIKHGLPQPEEFPDDVLKEIETIPLQVREEDLEGREDFRNKIIVTIDGEDAKDFDDAVEVTKTDRGTYILGVHIADVSHYVKEGSPLDREAFNRGTSVYLLDTVIPMLPKKLSNGICSLVEGEDRLTLSLIAEIDASGRTLNHRIVRGVIKSRKRLTYTEVNAYLEDDIDARERLSFMAREIEAMHELYRILRNHRKERGSILDIEGGEVRFIFDSNGRVKDIQPVRRGDAERIIEEFMIRANEIVAGIFDAIDAPFIYRIHEAPDPETVFNLRQYLDALGFSYKFPKSLHPGILQNMLEELRGHPLRSSVERLIVRSMKRALYSPVNVGHFGLASFSYTHFTSPIRRYPDLVVHRLLKEYLDGRLSGERIKHWEEKLPAIATHSSKMERRANEAEWDLTDLKKIDYISQHIGEVFKVYVTGVTRFGLFVEIPDKMVSGLVHVSTLDDHFHYDDQKNILLGENTGKVYRIGDELKVRVVSADKARMEVNFEPVED
ncbi:MAG: ribonuclease [Thermotogota bacterium]|nr:ribonuclease [Thermotogota bacterium]MDK2864726.1 ribonuclease [Thermotogota bacterium]HCZ06579.1 ribonuclease R [Thermotogota bacterium]